MAQSAGIGPGVLVVDGPLLLPKPSNKPLETAVRLIPPQLPWRGRGPDGIARYRYTVMNVLTQVLIITSRDDLPANP
jgi:hypothetical protein